ncbi:MAG: STAS domain-containing protein [Candidatus Omnitrophota bacterium]|jgi:anti-anti-sigma factor
MNIFAKIFNFNKEEKLPPIIKSIEQYENYSVVRLAGSYDFSTMPSIEGMMREHKGHGHFDQDIILDFKEVTHIDTSTLAVLIYIINTLKERHQRLFLINCNKMIKDHVKIGKLEPLIHIYDNLKDALKVLNKRPTPEVI